MNAAVYFHNIDVDCDSYILSSTCQSKWYLCSVRIQFLPWSKPLFEVDQFYHSPESVWSLLNVQFLLYWTTNFAFFTGIIEIYVCGHDVYSALSVLILVVNFSFESMLVSEPICRSNLHICLLAKCYSKLSNFANKGYCGIILDGKYWSAVCWNYNFSSPICFLVIKLYLRIFCWECPYSFAF